VSSVPFGVGSVFLDMGLKRVSSSTRSLNRLLITKRIGTLVVYPILQPSTAYWMLRPFFKPTVKGSLDGWKFSLDDDVRLPLAFDHVE
jgi:hypothetical protein